MIGRSFIGKLSEYAGLLIVLCLLPQCSSSNSPTDLSELYFPMAVGNRWTFIVSNTGEHIMTRKIIGKEVIDGHTYFVFEERNSDGSLWRTRFYRTDGEGRVLEYRNNQAAVEYDFTLPLDENMLSDNCCQSIRDKSLTVEVAAGSFRNSMMLYFDIPAYADEEFCSYFAPGVGLVKIDCVFGVPIELQSAIVNGYEY